MLVFLQFFSCTLSAPAPKEVYLQYLIHQSTHLLLASHIKYLSHNLTTNLALTTEQSQTNLYTSALLSQSQLLLQMWEQSLLHNGIKTWQCPTIVDEGSVEVQINRLEFVAESSLKTIDSQPYCIRNHQLRLNQDFQRLLRVDQGCRWSGSARGVRQARGGSWRKAGSKAPWSYGQLKKEQYAYKIQSLKSVYGAVACPSTTPFLNKINQCFNCINDVEIYNVGQKRCVNCRQGKCLIDGGASSSNSKATNVLKVVSHIKQAPSCAVELPYFTGQHCINCQLPLYFNPTSHQCLQCPYQTDNVSQTYPTCLQTQQPTTCTTTLGLPSNPPRYATVKHCPRGTPFPNRNNLCSACQSPRFFNYGKGECQSCHGRLAFITSAMSCGGGAGTKLNNSNLLGELHFVGQVPEYEVLLSMCPKDKRYFKGVQCSSCLLPTFFNFQTRSCEQCGQGQMFQVGVQGCVEKDQHFYSNLNHPNLYYNGDYQLQKREIKSKQAKGMQQCPYSTPFFDVKHNKCKSCPSGRPYFDIRRATCISCPTDSVFSLQARI